MRGRWVSDFDNRSLAKRVRRTRIENNLWQCGQLVFRWYLKCHPSICSKGDGLSGIRESRLRIINESCWWPGHRTCAETGKTIESLLFFLYHIQQYSFKIWIESFCPVLKTVKRSTSRELDDDSVNGQITKLIHADEQTATAFPILNLFISTGLVFDTSLKSYHLSIKKEISWENSNVSEIGNLNDSPDQLSEWQQSRQFWLINGYLSLERRP
jgi:hypothetical protein